MYVNCYNSDTAGKLSKNPFYSKDIKTKPKSVAATEKHKQIYITRKFCLYIMSILCSVQFADALFTVN